MNFNKNNNDKRFDKLFKDPKFKLIPKNVEKINIKDNRFSHMFKDHKFSSNNYVDEYGNKVKKSKYNKELESFYINKNLEYTNNKIDNTIANNNISERNSLDYSFNDIKSENSYSSNTSEEFNDFLNYYVQDQTKELDAWDKYKDKDVPIGDTSKYLSVMNLNWESINSKDLYVLFTSLSLKDNSVISVKIYPSEFGIKEREKENKDGPDREIFKIKSILNTKDDSNIINNATIIHNLEDCYQKVNYENYHKLDENKLREYELKKLKYYYAIIELKNKKIANYIYENYDGTEIEKTQMFMELRFVPEEIMINGLPYPPIDECNIFPKEYTQNIKKNRALDHSRVTLTWDKENEKREELIKRANTGKLRDDELEDLFASDSESNSIKQNSYSNYDYKSDEEKQVNKNLSENIFNINEINILNTNKHKKKNRIISIKDREEFDIVFDSGFEALDKNILKEENINIKDKSLFEQYKERKKLIGKEKKIEEKIKLDEKKKRRYQDQMFNTKYSKEDNNLNLLEDILQESDNNKIKNIDKKDNRFIAVKKDKNFWIDPTSTEYKKKIKSNKLIENK